jgi:hypothetical protein
MRNPFELLETAEKESYIYFDKHVRELPKRSDGSIDKDRPGFHDNDVDAFRHAYVSGIFAMEYGKNAAAIFGWINELSSTSTVDKRMDFWNNAIGRDLGLKYKNKEELLKAVAKSLKDGGLILKSSDPRALYKRAELPPLPDRLYGVVVLQESSTGANEIFYDLYANIVMTREEFVEAILAGAYPGYLVKKRNGMAYPVARKDDFTSNNLS